jgi:hypothetical protein
MKVKIAVALTALGVAVVLVGLQSLGNAPATEHEQLHWPSRKATVQEELNAALDRVSEISALCAEDPSLDICAELHRQ